MKTKKKNPYREIDYPRDQQHPIDAIVEKRLPPSLSEGILIGTKKLNRALGDDNSAWLELDAMLLAYYKQREELFFNIGYEHGFSAGSTKAYAIIQRQESNPEYHQFIGTVRRIALLCHISQYQKISAFLELAMGLLREAEQE